MKCCFRTNSRRATSEEGFIRIVKAGAGTQLLGLKKINIINVTKGNIKYQT